MSLCIDTTFETFTKEKSQRNKLIIKNNAQEFETKQHHLSHVTKATSLNSCAFVAEMSHLHSREHKKDMNLAVSQNCSDSSELNP